MATILIIDDEYALVESVEEILTWEGHRVLSAANGARGLELLEDERPDLILLDQMMPVMGGLEMLRRLRADLRHRDRVVLMMTAAPLRPTPGASWDGLLRKPFDVDALLRKVKEMLALGGSRGGTGSGGQQDEQGNGGDDGAAGGDQGDGGPPLSSLSGVAAAAGR